MGFPSNLEELQATGYVFHRTEPCLICKNNVEIFTTPGMREISMNQMYLLTSPAVRHYETCNTHTNPVEPPPVVDVPKTSLEPQQTQGGAEIDGIPMFGVTDPNRQLLSVGWSDGTLVCQWGKGKGYHTGVPEDLYMKLRRVPFAYRQYNATIKGKYPYTKLS
jgi:hypothetical protein